MIPIKQPTYKDGRTKQSFKNETDINKIMARAEKTGTISHLTKHEAHYGDFSNFDFFEANLQLTRGREIFDELPGEIRKEFGQSPAQFFAYVNDPANKEELLKKLPGLAAPGRQILDVSGKSEPDELMSPAVPDEKQPLATTSVATETPLAASSEPPKTE